MLETKPVNQMSGVSEWSVDDVITFFCENLDLDTDHAICNTIREHEITGELLPDLSLSDCQELCEEDPKMAVRLKVIVNKFASEQEANRQAAQMAVQQELLESIRLMYTNISAKLQDYQYQYASLKSSVLETVKNSSPRVRGSNVELDSIPARPELKSAQTMTAMSSGTVKPFYHHTDSHSSSPNVVTTASRQGSSTSINMQNTVQSSQPNKTQSPLEPLKQLRASKEDSCERVLKSAMARYNLNDQDWRKYVLVICYGEQERILDLNEKPVVIFKNLKQQGLHPSIMLRKRGDFQELDMTQYNGDITPGGRL